MKRYETRQIRNVALVGHSGAGKTSLAEALLHRAGAIGRLGRVEDGTTTCDHDPEEHKRGISLSLAVAPFEWRDTKINLIDTPGYADFMGDVAAALRVADLAVFVVSAVDGVQVQTEEIWEMARDRAPAWCPSTSSTASAHHDATLAQPATAWRHRPLELPIGTEAVPGIADLLTDTACLRGRRPAPSLSPTTGVTRARSTRACRGHRRRRRRDVERHRRASPASRS